MKNIIKISLLAFTLAVFLPAFSVNAGKPFDEPPGQPDTLSEEECLDLASELNETLPEDLCASCEQLCHGQNNCNYRIAVEHCE